MASDRPDVVFLPTKDLVSKYLSSCRATKRDHFISEGYYTLIEGVTKGIVATSGGIASYTIAAYTPGLISSSIRTALPYLVFTGLITFLVNTGDWGALVKGHRRVGAEYNILYRGFYELHNHMGDQPQDEEQIKLKWRALCLQRDKAEREGLPTYSWEEKWPRLYRYFERNELEENKSPR